MDSKHTPGPWQLNTQYADIEVRGPAESGVLIAVMSPWGVSAKTPNPQAANARLIAAAPDLLECLQNAVLHATGERRARYLTAIAKATGAQQ